MMRPTEQIYETYTPVDFEVWATLYNRQMNLLRSNASKAYLDALEAIQFTPEKIPDFKELNLILGNITGWSVHTVPCISPARDFFRFLSMRKFTSTCWLRSKEQLDYLEEPDMFHDVFGHVPLLSNVQYTDFFLGISKIAMRNIDDPSVIDLLGKIYWFTIEFGLIREHGDIKIYGAGIISSHKESENCFGGNSALIDFDVSKILETDYRTDKLQNLYFVIDSFEQLYNSLDEIERKVTEAVNTADYELCSERHNLIQIKR